MQQLLENLKKAVASVEQEISKIVTQATEDRAATYGRADAEREERIKAEGTLQHVQTELEKLKQDYQKLADDYSGSVERLAEETSWKAAALEECESLKIRIAEVEQCFNECEEARVSEYKRAEDLSAEVRMLETAKQHAFARVERVSTELSETRQEREAALGRAEAAEAKVSELEIALHCEETATVARMLELEKETKRQQEEIASLKEMKTLNQKLQQCFAGQQGNFTRCGHCIGCLQADVQNLAKERDAAVAALVRPKAIAPAEMTRGDVLALVDASEKQSLTVVDALKARMIAAEDRCRRLNEFTELVGRHLASVPVAVRTAHADLSTNRD